MVRSRLHTLAADLDAALVKAPAARSRQAAWAAARWAVERVGLDHPAVAAALASRQPDDLASAVTELDERYFELDRSGVARPTVLAAFALARAASAVEFAARGEAAEAVYEAAIATDDVLGIRAVVASALDAGGRAEPDNARDWPIASESEG